MAKSEATEAPPLEDVVPQTRKRKPKVDLPTPKEFAMTVIQGMVIRAGAGAFAHNAMLSLKANIAKGYEATCEVIEELANDSA